METHPTHAQDIEAKRDEISEAWGGLKDQVRIHFVITTSLRTGSVLGWEVTVEVSSNVN
jgi:hypothetical protein